MKCVRCVCRLNGPSYIRARSGIWTNEDAGEERCPNMDGCIPTAKVPHWLDVTWKALVTSESQPRAVNRDFAKTGLTNT